MMPTQAYMRYQCYLQSGLTELEYCTSHDVTPEKLEEMKRIHDKMYNFFNKKVSVQHIGS